MPRYKSVAVPVSEVKTTDWRLMKPFDAFKLVARGELDQDQFEDYFKLTAVELENLIWLTRTS